jgi:nitroimidazol reductase NimA-like FMN-containing flavoprotein (pyridoxamine 5'-phosphate oxidase superfamily)
MREKEAWHRLQTLLASEPLAVLGTSAQDEPYASLVAFAATEDSRHILFATTRATHKYRNLESNPRVALLVDNRSKEESDFHEAMAATILGRTVERDIRDPENRQKLETFLAKHPYLSDFVHAPTCAFIDVVVDRCYLVTRFQQVIDLRVSR